MSVTVDPAWQGTAARFGLYSMVCLFPTWIPFLDPPLCRMPGPFSSCIPLCEMFCPSRVSSPFLGPFLPLSLRCVLLHSFLGVDPSFRPPHNRVVQEKAESLRPRGGCGVPAGARSTDVISSTPPAHCPASWYRREEVVFEPLPWHPTWQRSRSPGPDSKIRSSRFLPHRRKDAMVSQSLAPARPLTLKCLENPPREVLVPACLPRAQGGAGKISTAMSSRAADRSSRREGINGNQRKSPSCSALFFF